MQIVIGLVAAVVLFLVVRGKAAVGAGAGAPPGAPDTYLQPSTAITAGAPLSPDVATRARTPVPNQTAALPPPPELWYGKGVVRRAGTAMDGGGALQIFEAPIATRGGALAGLR